MRGVVAILILVGVEWMQGITSLTEDVPFLNLMREMLDWTFRLKKIQIIQCNTSETSEIILSS